MRDTETLAIKAGFRTAGIRGLNSANLIDDPEALADSLGENADEIMQVLGIVPAFNDDTRKGFEVDIADAYLDAAIAVPDDRDGDWTLHAAYNCIDTARWRKPIEHDDTGMPITTRFDLEAFHRHVTREHDKRRYFDIESAVFYPDKRCASGYGRTMRRKGGSLNQSRPSKADRIKAKLAALDARKARRQSNR